MGQWIEEVVGLGQYRLLFAQNDVTGEILPSLTLDILKTELGISSLGHRMKILNHTKALASSLPPSSPSTSGASSTSIPLQPPTTPSISIVLDDPTTASAAPVPASLGSSIIHLFKYALLLSLLNTLQINRCTLRLMNCG